MLRGIPTRACRHRDDVPRDIRELFWRIAARDASAMSWREGDLITFCVIPRSRVNPEWHRVIEDEALRDEAKRLIDEYGLPMSNADDPDAVLILAPAV